jgi:hypothetical protein
MENFFNYIATPVTEEEINIWIKSNNIIFEKLSIFQDFVISLVLYIQDTYLGEHEENSETNIKMSEEDIYNHFLWCWNKVIKNFAKESIFIDEFGDHFTFIKDFINEIFYFQKNKQVRDSVILFFIDVFKLENQVTKSDLDLILTMYKSLNKNTKFGFTS